MELVVVTASEVKVALTTWVNWSLALGVKGQAKPWLPAAPQPAVGPLRAGGVVMPRRCRAARGMAEGAGGGDAHHLAVAVDRFIADAVRVGVVHTHVDELHALALLLARQACGLADEVRLVSADEALHGGLEHVDLLKDNLGVNDAAVTDHRHVVGIHDAGGHLVQAVLLAVDDDGVAGVITARIAHDGIEVAGDQVANLTLALIAPLGTDQNG